MGIGTETRGDVPRLAAADMMPRSLFLYIHFEPWSEPRMSLSMPKPSIQRAKVSSAACKPLVAPPKCSHHQSAPALMKALTKVAARLPRAELACVELASPSLL